MSKTTKSKTTVVHADPHQWIKSTKIKTSADIEVPTRLIDQVIGQDSAVQVALKAAEQKRHLLLIGDPGTGKSMLAKAMAEVLPAEEQRDVIVYGNIKNPNVPKILEVEGSKGREIVARNEKKAKKKLLVGRIIDYTIGLGILVGGLAYWAYLGFAPTSALMFLFAVLLSLLFIYFRNQNRPKLEALVPKLIIEHSKDAERAPYVDATGSHAGALLGDVRHDPFQSGGLETPAHQRVEVGAIHRAHKGVLFIDEINVLRLDSQQALLTAMQDRKYSIVGQSQTSAGAMIKTEPVPCEFILVAAGNLDAVQPPDASGTRGMHPALRSRIRGYGYEVFVNHLMDDNAENRLKLCQFVAQEVVRDGKIPHLDAAAIAEVIREAQRRSGRTGKLTLRLRELGGLVRTAGDYARKDAAEVVTLKHVREAKAASRSLEQQITDKEIELAILDEGVERVGKAVGIANGVAIIGTGEVGEPAGLVVPVEAAVVPALSRSGGTIVLGEQLRESRGSGVENVGAVLKIVKGSSIADYDIHVDANILHQKASADGIGIAAAVAALSALESIPVRLEYCMIGTVGVSGDLKPVRATLQRIEACAQLGYKYVLVPEGVRKTLLVDDYIQEKIQIVYCRTLAEVLERVLAAPLPTLKALTKRMSNLGKASEEDGVDGTLPVQSVKTKVIGGQG